MFPLYSISPRLRVSIAAPWPLVFLALVLGFTQCNAAPAARAEACNLDDCLDAVCRVHGPDGGLGTGCVFAIDAGRDAVYVLTNAHVAGARAGTAVSVEFWQQGYASRELPAVVDFATPDYGVGWDLAIVAVNLSAFQNNPPRVIPLQERGLELCAGDAVVSVGCARGAWPSLFRGHVERLPAGRIEFTPPIAQGRSGSALLDGEGRRIVGLCGWLDTEAGLSLAMDLDAIYRVLDGAQPARFDEGATPLRLFASSPQSDLTAGPLRPIPMKDCPNGDCWQPFGGAFRRPQPPQPSRPSQPNSPPATGGAWPNKPAAGAPAIDTSQYALKSELTSLTGRVSALEKSSAQAVTPDQLDHVLANAKADLQKALAGNVQGAVSDAASQIKQDALAAVETKAHRVVSDTLGNKLAPLAEITTTVTGIAAKLGLPAAAANPWLAPLVTGFSIVSGLLGGAGLVRGKLTALQKTAAPGGSSPSAVFQPAANGH